MFKNLLGKEPKSIVSEGYKKWRDTIFQTKPENAGTGADEPNKVYGVIMDIGMIDKNANAAFALTTAALASGEATFFPTPGGGVMGLGNDPRVAEVAKSIVAQGQIFLAKAQPAKDNPLPGVGKVTFYFLTTSGLFSTTDQLNALQSGPYGQLLAKFGQIRGVAERMIDSRRR